MHDELAEIAEHYGTPCYVYDFDRVRERVAYVRAAFGGRFRISYAVKCNPNPALLARLAGVVDALDISSGGELARAIHAGWAGGRLSFTGPAKRDWELAAAVDRRAGHVVLESTDEARRLDALARRAGVRQAVLIRVAPAQVPGGFGSRMAGRPSHFGIDEAEVEAAITRVAALAGLDLQGFHVYSGTQCLDADAVARNYLLCARLFTRLSDAHALTPRKFIFGSGLGIPYHGHDEPLDLSRVAAQTLPALDALRERFAEAELVLETGRYLVGEAGVYLTRVIGAKRSHGSDVRICDGGMNHHLAACGHLGSVIRRNYRMFKVTGDAPGAPGQPFDLFGPLCTSIDVLGQGVSFPSLDVGDVVAVECSGAYGLTASPIHFISHDPPAEVLAETVDGRRVTLRVNTPFAPDAAARKGER